jgi:hypothetical protein
MFKPFVFWGKPSNHFAGRPAAARRVARWARRDGEIGVRKDNGTNLYIFSIYNGRYYNGAYLGAAALADDGRSATRA